MWPYGTCVRAMVCLEAAPLFCEGVLALPVASAETALDLDCRVKSHQRGEEGCRRAELWVGGLRHMAKKRKLPVRL